jgi:hypothetical protein
MRSTNLILYQLPHLYIPFIQYYLGKVDILILEQDFVDVIHFLGGLILQLDS